MSRDKIVVQDPTVVGAVSTDGETYRGDMPEQNYERIEIHTPDGDEVTVAVGDELYDSGRVHGEVTRIARHPNNGIASTWEWTVWFQYTSGSEGGVPLGELATQLDEGAVLH